MASTEFDLPIASIGSGSYSLCELTAYHFSVRADGEVEHGTTYDTELTNPQGETLRCKVRTRRLENGLVLCRFNDLTLAARAKLESWLRQAENPEGSGDALNRLSYDEIARGRTGVPEDAGAVDRPVAPPLGGSRRTPLLVFLLIVLLMASFVAGLVFFAHGRYRIKVNDGSLTGNYRPVQVAETGIIRETLCKEGDLVKKGDLLLTMENRELDEAVALAEADVAAARAQVTALEQRIESQQRKFLVAVKDGEQKVLAARALRTKARVQFESQGRITDALAPLTTGGTVAALDYQKEIALLRSLDAEMEVQNAQFDRAKTELAAMESGEFLMLGDRIDDTLAENRAQMGIAKAAVAKAAAQREASKHRQELLQVVAPADGRIFAIYRHSGEYVRTADPVLSMDTSERLWAFGSVSQRDADKVRPGQKVLVAVPAFHAEVIGKIASVGHRSVYTEGGWTPDFKVDPLSVPVKVWLPDIADTPPPGIRLKMVIQLPFQWPWQRQEKYDAASGPKALATPNE